PRRRLPLAGWVGVAALAVSVAVSAAGSGWGLHSNPSGATASPPAGEGEARGRGELRAVGFGFVDVEHGVVSLYPVQPGRVTEVLVEENAEAEPDAPLFRVDDALARAQADAARADLEAAEEQLR